MGILHQLIGVPVAGHHDHVLTLVAGLGGQCGNHVVGLNADVFHRGDLEGVHQLADQSHLLAEGVRGLAAIGLVAGDPLVAEGGLGAIEGHCHPVGAVVAQQRQQHHGEAVHRVGYLAAGGGHVLGQGEEGPIGQRVAVHQHDRARLSHLPGLRLAPSAGRHSSRRSRRPPRP